MQKPRVYSGPSDETILRTHVTVYTDALTVKFQKDSTLTAGTLSCRHSLRPIKDLKV